MGGTICTFTRSQSQVTKSLLWLSYSLVRRLLKCVETAEEKLGKPPTSVEVFVELRLRYFNHLECVETPYQVAAMLASILREDWIYVDAEAKQFSVHERAGFITFS